MKKILLPPLLLLFACVSEPQKTSDPVGNVKRFEPQSLSFDDGMRIEAICLALASKENLLNVITPSGMEYTFSYTQKGCTESALPTPRTVVTTIEKGEASFIFRSKTGESFGFTEVETPTKGALAEICKSLGSLTSPLQTSRSGAVWFTTMSQSEHCRSDAENYCIYLQRGTAIDSLNYEIHTDEWIKFKITSEKRGFFIERKLVSTSGCSKGTIEKRATLK